MCASAHLARPRQRRRQAPKKRADARNGSSTEQVSKTRLQRAMCRIFDETSSLTRLLKSSRIEGFYADSAFTRADNRESLRATVRLWITPFEAARCNSGCAALKASAAAALSPDLMASSTFRRNVRTRDRRDLFTAVRRAILRTIFLADEVLAMGLPLNALNRR